MTAGEELERLGKEIMRIGNEIKTDIDVSQLTPEEAEKALEMLKGFKYILEKENLKLYRIWQKIKEEENKNDNAI